jgi:cell division protein FtsN
MKKHFNPANVLLLAVFWIFVFSGCETIKNITGNNNDDKTDTLQQDTIYYVQAGAFHNQNYAQKRAVSLSKKLNYRLEITIEDNLYRIILGPFTGKADARRCKQAVIREGYEDAFIDTPEKQN